MKIAFEISEYAAPPFVRDQSSSGRHLPEPVSWDYHPGLAGGCYQDDGNAGACYCEDPNAGGCYCEDPIAR